MFHHGLYCPDPNCPTCGPASIGRRPLDPEQDGLWTILEEKLLAIGGTRAVWREGATPDLRKIVERGHEVVKPVKFLGLEPQLCHEHAAKLWGRDPDHVTIMTGFGLYHDGVWRDHSWATRGNVLLETNLQDDKYFGYELDKMEAKLFFVGNYILRHSCCLPAWYKNSRKSFPKVAKIIQKDVRRFAKQAARQQYGRLSFAGDHTMEAGCTMAL